MTIEEYTEKWKERKEPQSIYILPDCKSDRIESKRTTFGHPFTMAMDLWHSMHFRDPGTLFIPFPRVIIPNLCPQKRSLIGQHCTLLCNQVAG